MDEDLVISPDEFITLSKPQQMPSTTQPMVDEDPDISIPADQIAFTPYEDKALRKEAGRVGLGRDGKPVLNLQAADNIVRLKTQLFFDSPDEKIKYLKQQMGSGWEFDKHPRDAGNVIMRKKGDSTWGVLDPGNGGIPELLQEIGENVDMVAQAAAIPASALTAGLAAGGIQATRQALKKLMLPEAEFDVLATGIDTAAGALTGGTATGAKAGLTAMKEGAVNAASKAKGIGKEIVARGGETSMWQKVKNIPSMLESPDWIAREIGATADQLNPFQKKTISENIGYLQKNVPEFKEAMKQYTLKGKFDVMDQMLTKTGQEIGAAFNDPNKVVQVSDILSSEPFQNLMTASTKGVVQKGKGAARVTPLVRARIEKTKREAMTQLAEMVLPDDMGWVTKAYNKGGLHKHKNLKQFGFKNNDEAMAGIIGTEQIPMSDAWLARIGGDEVVKYGKRKGAIDSVSSARKMIPDAYRQAMEKSLRETMGDAAEEIIGKSELYHNLLPVVATTAKKVGKEAAETWNPIKTIPGTLYSAPRFAVALGRNLLQRTEVTSALRKGQLAFPIPENVPYMSPKAGRAAMQRALRGAQFTGTEATLETQLLPRDASKFMEDPTAIEQLTAAVGSSELTDTMIRQYERGDQEGFANTLSMVASENEELFDKAPYKSLVTQNGKPVITDKYDREAYRQYIDKNVLDPKERFLIKQALNFKNEMKEAPFTPPKQPLKVLPSTSSNKPKSARKTAVDNLKKADTVQLDDGTERMDYDY